MKKIKFKIDVFHEGRQVLILNNVYCTHAHVALIVALLDLGKHCLHPGHYFAADYA